MSDQKVEGVPSAEGEAAPVTAPEGGAAAAADTAANAEPVTEMATFGGGHFGATEKFFRKDFQDYFARCILGVTVGYTGGIMENPTYRDILTYDTQHIMVAQITFDPKKTSFGALCRFFFTFHDPTVPGRMEWELASHYNSAIFYHSEEQKKEAEKVIAELNDMLEKDEVEFQNGGRFDETKVVTEVRPATTFYEGERTYQNYYSRKPWYECEQFIRFKWPNLRKYKN